MTMRIVSFILLVNFHFYQANGATVEFDISLADGQPNLELDCTYSLAKDETLYKVLLKKDGQTFVSFTDKNKDKPDFTKVEGISEVTLHGSGKVKILNWQDSTWGIYSCVVLYDLKSAQNKAKKSKRKIEPGAQSVVKKLRIKLKGGEGPCKPNWAKGTPGTIPSDAYPAGISNGAYLYVCRAIIDDSTTPGFVVDQGCQITYAGDIKTETTYEILTGVGFEWKPHTGNNQDTPTDSYQAGQDGTGTLFCAGCRHSNGDVYLGKIGDKFYYAMDGSEHSNDCPDPNIMLCKQG